MDTRPAQHPLDTALVLEAVFHGPNPFTSDPVVVFTCGRDAAPSDDALLAGVAAIRSAWPDWFDGPLPAGPALLQAGLVAVQWALCALNMRRGMVRAAGAAGHGDGVRMWLGFHHAALSQQAMVMAWRALSLASRQPDTVAQQVQPELERLWQACGQRHPDYQAAILLAAARARDVPVMPFIGGRFWQYGWGARSRVMLESASNADGYLAGMFDRSKVLGKAAFVALGMPTPPHVLVHDREGLPAAAEAVGWPCVLKPVSSGGGRGVTAHLLDLQSLHRAWDHATALERPPMLVEAWVPGEDHRLMVIDGQLVAVIRREASQVVGDGRCTVAELVHRLNATRDDNFSRSNYLRKIPLGEVLQRQLAAQGLSLDRVPDAGRQVRLRSNANLSTGGICIDVTAAVHPDVRQGAETIAQALGIGTAGIDYITTDISRSPAACGGRFIEVNLAPGVDAMIAAGWDPAAVGSLVLGPQVGRIPVRLVLVPGAQLPQALVDLMASSPADGVGWACGDRARIGALELSLRAGEGGPDLGTVLRHPQLQHLLVVASTEALLRHGLPLDRFDHVDAVLQAVPEAWHAVLQASAASVQAIGSWDRRQVLAPA